MPQDERPCQNGSRCGVSLGSFVDHGKFASGLIISGADGRVPSAGCGRIVLNSTSPHSTSTNCGRPKWGRASGGRKSLDPAFGFRPSPWELQCSRRFLARRWPGEESKCRQPDFGVVRKEFGKKKLRFRPGSIIRVSVGPRNGWKSDQRGPKLTLFRLVCRQSHTRCGPDIPCSSPPWHQ